MRWYVIEHEGKLGVTMDWEENYSRPVSTRSIYGTNLSARIWPELIDKAAELIPGTDRMRVNVVPGRDVYIDVSHHPVLFEERPIPRPRKRKNGDVPVWRNGHWSFYSLPYAQDNHPEQYPPEEGGR